MSNFPVVKVKNSTNTIIDPATSTQIGEVQASPTAYTILDRLKSLYTALTGGSQKTQIVDGTGAIAAVTDNSLRVINQTYQQAIAEGYIAGHTLFYKIGYSPASTAAETTLWNLVTQYVFPTVNIAVEAISTSGNDIATTGSGARTVHLSYLDSTYAEKTFTFNMNGVTAVTGPTDFFRVNSFHIETSGAGGKAAGVISLRLVGAPATIYEQMPVGGTRSRNSVYTVPLGKKLYITTCCASAAYNTSGKSVRVILHASLSPDGLISTAGYLFWPQFESMLVDGVVHHTFASPLVLTEKTDIKTSVVGETNAIVTSLIDGWMELLNT